MKLDAEMAIGIILLFMIIALFLSIGRADAAEFNDQNIIRAIIGEAANQGEMGQYAVASAILNRGTLNGVYGLKAKHIDSQPQWVWESASNALQKAKERRLHEGQYWGSTLCDKEWINKMKKAGYIEVYRYKQQVFYKGV